MNTNVCVFTGRVTAQAETKNIKDSVSITTFSIAVNERIKDASKESGYGNRANFVDMAIFGNYGDRLRPALSKGREVTVTCRYHQDRWEKDGKKFQKAVFYVDNIVIQREGKGASTTVQSAQNTQESFELPPPEVQDLLNAFPGSEVESLVF